MGVKLVKGGVEFQYSSLNDACLKNGSTYGRNTTNAVKYLSSVGFDMSQFANITTTRTRSDVSVGIIDRLVKMLSVVDKARVDQLSKELQGVLSAELSDKTLGQARKLQKDIELASKPQQPTLDAIIEKVKVLYTEWSSNQATETKTETSVEQKVEQPKQKTKK